MISWPINVFCEHKVVFLSNFFLIRDLCLMLCMFLALVKAVIMSVSWRLLGTFLLFVLFTPNVCICWNCNWNNSVVFFGHFCRHCCHGLFIKHRNKINIGAIRGGRVVWCRTCDREVVGSNPARGCCYQHLLSVPSLRGWLMSTSESWGVNGHTTRCTSHVPVVLQLRLSYSKRRSAPPHGPLRLGKGLYFTFGAFHTSDKLRDESVSWTLSSRCSI